MKSHLLWINICLIASCMAKFAMELCKRCPPEPVFRALYLKMFQPSTSMMPADLDTLFHSFTTVCM